MIDLLNEYNEELYYYIGRCKVNSTAPDCYCDRMFPKFKKLLFKYIDNSKDLNDIVNYYNYFIEFINHSFNFILKFNPYLHYHLRNRISPIHLYHYLSYSLIIN